MANHVRFYKFPVLMGFKSKQEGREIYQDHDYIEIQVPGQKNQIIKRGVREKDKIDYPTEWTAYDAGRDEAHVGTPIDRIPGISPSMVKELQALGVYTVESMAECSETGLQKIGHGARDLKNRAESYIGDSSKIESLEKKNEILAKQLEELSKQMAAVANTKPEKGEDMTPAQKRMAKARAARKPTKKAA